MPLSSFPIASSSLPPLLLHHHHQQVKLNFRRVTVNPTTGRNAEFAVRSSGSSVQFDVQFPGDYDELLDQAKEATQVGLNDGLQLMSFYSTHLSTHRRLSFLLLASLPSQVMVKAALK